MNLCLVSMSHVFFRAIRAVFSSKTLRLSLPGLLLAGCVSHPPQSAISDKQEDKWPENQLADFLSTRCEDIWHLSGHDVESNPLFWLRGIDCAQRLAPVEARAQAAMLADNTWQDAFKRGIVLADAKITPVERRANITRLDTFVMNIPTQVRPVYQLWRDGQTLQLQLSEERSRYSRLQQSTDGELDTLRQQQDSLRTQLDTTTRKLENLTDIERQLSSRKYQPGSSSAVPDSDTQKQEDVKHDEP
ncbi:two-component system QseEF-associated lipoprotein QseG [Enterobacter huaxiensis]|uniref:Two-component system QseEF-associated lipoprotein QseG n=1 Tax=Enterobacter huaxiensis TaxID=2494702 RepID=A0ABU6ERK1_9ENTR|nr:two-component system QseEF-associated lipoprotein QseG [Enterobacter huaxiensis]MCS5451563.1 two-component system QseEF-associated lipoprotein QseG [Enterobacter huaxiensis]MEB7543678.1 two-component system QseEF-associated lipoprotein QseG [Enterobacter huaxiensis]MEB7579292.1 two-component system QseEF-associated lipoprotein QseG [Enterobacter huaxiensis]MEB7662510.1 two-component system QseEF-associated lipoprotein QseG [Enterobacter huaxiensis]UNC49163.1 two-component system QseEF-assoc